MAGIRITELESATNVQDTDLLVIEQTNGTRKLEVGEIRGQSGLNIENGEGTGSLKQTNATAYANNSLGLNTSIAGSKAFETTRILSNMGNVVYNITDENCTGIEVGMEGNLYINDGQTDTNYMQFGKVTEVIPNYSGVGRIRFDTAVAWQGADALIDSYIWFTGHPELGDITIGDGAVAQGFNTNASQVGSHSEGSNTIALGKYSHAEGSGSVAGGYCSHAEGRDTKTKGMYAFASGRASEANGDYSQAGIQGVANGSNSLAIGTSVQANGNYSIALGHGSQANANESVAIGNNNTASGNASLALGQSNISSGQYSATLNSGNIASGYGSMAIGTGTVASGGRALSFGYNNTASGTTAVAGGVTSVASHDTSLVFGTRLTTSRNNQVVIGRDNANDANALFIIGNGTQNNKANAFEVINAQNLTSIKVGSVTLSEVDLSDISNLPSQMMTISDDVALLKGYLNNDTLTLGNTTLDEATLQTLIALANTPSADEEEY